MTIIKHYRTREEAEAACAAGETVKLEGNAIRRWRVMSIADQEHEAKTIESAPFQGRECAIPPATGAFPGI